MIPVTLFLYLSLQASPEPEDCSQRVYTFTDLKERNLTHFGSHLKMKLDPCRICGFKRTSIWLIAFLHSRSSTTCVSCDLRIYRPRIHKKEGFDQSCPLNVMREWSLTGASCIKLTQEIVRPCLSHTRSRSRVRAARADVNWAILPSISCNLKFL